MIYIEDVVVKEGSSPDYIVFNVSLSRLANPNIQEDMRVWFVGYYGYNSYELEVDRAPNSDVYFIQSYVVPELPWPTPLIFIPFLLLMIYYLYKKLFQRR